MATYLIKANTLADGLSLRETSPRRFARDKNGNLFAVYHRSDGTRNQVYISKSDDGGENWTEYKVTDDAEAHEQPSIAIDSNDYIYVVCIAIAGYNTYDIWQIVKSTNGGESWGSPVDINAEERAHSYPVIAIDSNDYIHIACLKDYATNVGIVYTKSTNGGSNWDANTDIAETSSFEQTHLAIIIDSNNYIHLAFIGKHSGSTVYFQLRYRKYTDSWQAIENLTSGAGHKVYVSIAIDNNDYIHIAFSWLTLTFYQVWYAKYTDSWALEAITTGDYHHAFPSISVDDDNEIYIFFYGYHAGSPTYRQIGYNHYTDSWSGISWLTSGDINNWYSNAIFARWPIDGSAKVNIPDTGFAFIWAEDDDIKIYLSADLTWQTGVIVKTFQDSGIGTDNLLVDKTLIFPDSGIGIDKWVLPAITYMIFSDSGSGADAFKVDKTLVFSDAGSGIDIFKIDKTVVFSDVGEGVDVFLIDKEAIFKDVATAIDKFRASYPYPRDLKRKIIIIRDIK